MSKVILHTKLSLPQPPEFVGRNLLPELLQTPSGLAILELQGTINLPDHDNEDAIAIEGHTRETSIGRLVFPGYKEGQEGQAWMKRVYLYVGKHQRLTGEVKKLPKAMAVIRKIKNVSLSNSEEIEGVEDQEKAEELEIVEIIKFKILFSTRPEPVGAMPAS
ncbi:chromosome transmission fidelity protein 8 [Bisporella sp. PMI_857]|nr:chromosome transmission fidelity protein 8 [Bisporella sp. PMI_857]